MPAKAKVTREMIVDAAFAVARETGAETISARTVSERLHCSTQPVMYHFATIEELKRTVYAKADQYHSDYLMRIKKPQKGAALGISALQSKSRICSGSCFSRITLTEARCWS